ALLAAIAGAAFMTRELILGRNRRTLAFVAVLGPASALYIWRASAVPDHIWVMRRYIVSALPLFVLLVFWFVAWISRAHLRAPVRGLVRIGAAALAIAAFAWPFVTTLPVASMSEQRGYLDVVRRTCGVIGRDSAVVVLSEPTDLIDQWTPQTLRSWCD